MDNSASPHPDDTEPEAGAESTESFEAIFSDYEQSHSRKTEGGKLI